jgi:hypothetical protein
MIKHKEVPFETDSILIFQLLQLAVVKYDINEEKMNFSAKVIQIYLPLFDKILSISMNIDNAFDCTLYE